MSTRARRGTHERQWDQTYKQWRDLGHHIDPVVASALRGQAKAADALVVSNQDEAASKVLARLADQVEKFGPKHEQDEAHDPWDSLAAHLSSAEVGDTAPTRTSD